MYYKHEKKITYLNILFYDFSILLSFFIASFLWRAHQTLNKNKWYYSVFLKNILDEKIYWIWEKGRKIDI